MCCSHVALGSLCSGQRWLPSMAVRVKGPEEKRRQPCEGGEGHRNGGLRQLSTPR